jgi:hypothetical protein
VVDGLHPHRWWGLGRGAHDDDSSGARTPVMIVIATMIAIVIAVAVAVVVGLCKCG